MAAQTLSEFLERWRKADPSERQSCQPFLIELCELLDLPKPEVSGDAYVFDRPVVFRNEDGTQNLGRIDLYRKGCLVLEAKQTGLEIEAQRYARALPAEEGRPPFLIVCDVGRSFNLYSEFSRSGGAYVPFPDPRSYRIRLDDLEREDVRETLRAIWTEPLSLDPARRSARVTRAIAADLGKLAEGLEKAGHNSETVAGFLMRTLFTMFAEAVGLLPKACFKTLLEDCPSDPVLFQRMVPGLWRTMNMGGFSPEIRSDLLRFKGGLFAEQTVLPLSPQQIELLLEAARADWRHVEPAIFGTLLERAGLDRA